MRIHHLDLQHGLLMISYDGSVNSWELSRLEQTELAGTASYYSTSKCDKVIAALMTGRELPFPDSNLCQTLLFVASCKASIGGPEGIRIDFYAGTNSATHAIPPIEHIQENRILSERVKAACLLLRARQKSTDRWVSA